MKVILKQTVPKVGKEGAIVQVADGFARNYLFPRSLAILADKTQIQAQAKRNERLAAKVADQKSQAEDLRAKLNGASVSIDAKVGAGQNKLFGAITNADIAEAVSAQLGISIDKKHVALIDPIKKLGSYEIELDLHREVEAKIHVNVVDPNAPVVVAPVVTEETAEAEVASE